MSTDRYVIAGLKVEMETIGELLQRRSQKYLCNFSDTPDIIIMTDRSKWDILKSRDAELSDQMCEYITTSAMFYNSLIAHDGFLLHSSAVEFGGKAYMFTADSGTGKSTHTRLWRQYIKSVNMINDDKPAVRLIDGEFYAAGTPWSGKTDQNASVLVPVGAAALLYRSEQNEISPADKKTAVHAFLKQTLLPADPTYTDRLAVLLDKFIRTVPIYNFGCNISEDAVKTSFEAMTKQKYGV